MVIWETFVLESVMIIIGYYYSNEVPPAKQRKNQVIWKI